MPPGRAAALATRRLHRYAMWCGPGRGAGEARRLGGCCTLLIALRGWPPQVGTAAAPRVAGTFWRIEEPFPAQGAEALAVLQYKGYSDLQLATLDDI